MFFFIRKKHSNLIAKIGKRRKTKFGRIDSCSQFEWDFSQMLFFSLVYSRVTETIEARHFPSFYPTTFQRPEYYPPATDRRPIEWHPPLVVARKKSTRKKYFPIVPEGTMLFSFLLRIPITFTTYLVPVATTGRETSSLSSSSMFVSDELSSFFNHILDLLSSAVKKFEEVLSEQRRYSDDAINDDTK